jgi:colanic acid/amylovoran biosynthesis protein
MEKIVFHSHGGSGNRGCEAIVRGSQKIIKKFCGNSKIYLCSLNKEEDTIVNLDQITPIIKYNNYVKKNSMNHLLAFINNRIFGNTEKYITLAQKNLYKMFDNKAIAVSIGGDNYCYSDSKWLHTSHKEAKKRNTKTVLWGCSLEEYNMNDEMLEDLKGYDLIVARESITYNLLIKYGIDKNTKLYPDPAFQLDMQSVDLPYNFKEDNTIGINLSPYIFKSNLKKNEVIDLYISFIRHIIKTSDMQVALIPHVFWNQSNDSEILELIYSKFKDTGRVLLVNTKYNCMQLKYLISKCRLFIGARTHSTIAAYSTCVPTLVLGYSVKSKGIARDIFGSEESMVISVEELNKKEDLIKAYEFIKENEDNLRNHLKKFIPTYKEKAMEAGNELKKISNTIN